MQGPLSLSRSLQKVKIGIEGSERAGGQDLSSEKKQDLQLRSSWPQAPSSSRRWARKVLLKGKNRLSSTDQALSLKSVFLNGQFPTGVNAR